MGSRFQKVRVHNGGGGIAAGTGNRGNTPNYTEEGEREREQEVEQDDKSPVTHFLRRCHPHKASVASINSANCWGPGVQIPSLLGTFFIQVTGVTLQRRYLDTVFLACNPSTLVAGEEGLGVQGSPQLHSKLEANLSYRRSYLQNIPSKIKQK